MRRFFALLFAALTISAVNSPEMQDFYKQNPNYKTAIDQLNRMIELGETGIRQLIASQRELLRSAVFDLPEY